MAVSAYVMHHISQYRNPILQQREGERRELVSPWRLLAAEIGYIAATCFAMLETAGYLVAFGVTAMIRPGQGLELRCEKMVPLGVYTVGYGMMNVLTNPFRETIPDTVIGFIDDLDRFSREILQYF